MGRVPVTVVKLDSGTQINAALRIAIVNHKKKNGPMQAFSFQM
jgi:hypothetical protein